MKIGDYVKIREDSEYYLEQAFSDENGTKERIFIINKFTVDDDHKYQCITVDKEKYENSYRIKDLIRYYPKKFDRKKLSL